MKIYIGTDHAGYELKEKFKVYLKEMGHEVVDKGAFKYDIKDDYPDFIIPVAVSVAEDPGSRGIIMGASGQGEAMCANRVPGARAALFYGNPAQSQTDADGTVLDMIKSARMHNDANILSIATRFVGEQDAMEAIMTFIDAPFLGDERHVRRLKKMDAVTIGEKK